MQKEINIVYKSKHNNKRKKCSYNKKENRLHYYRGKDESMKRASNENN